MGAGGNPMRDQERSPATLEEFFEAVGTNWTFDPLRDPKWTPSREDYLSLREGAREALAVLEQQLAEKDEALHPRVARFASLMGRELAANAYKDSHPLSNDPAHLLGQLREHVEKLAVHPSDEHAADVANLAMLYREALRAEPAKEKA